MSATEHTDAMTLAGIQKLEAQLRVAAKNVEMHKEQYAQERDNAAMLYRALVRHAPDALAEIKSQLWQSTGEYDKLMSEASREREKRIRAEAALQRQLADAQARERAAVADNAEAVRLMKDLQWNHAQGVTGDLETDHDVYIYLSEHGAFKPEPFLLDYDDEATAQPADGQQQAGG